MTISRPAAAVLGLLTLLPSAFMVVLVAVITRRFVEEGPDPHLLDFVLSGTAGALVVAMTFLVLALDAFYLVHAIRNPDFAPEVRILWIALLLCTHVVGSMLYWWFHIWRGSPSMQKAA